MRHTPSNKVTFSEKPISYLLAGIFLGIFSLRIANLANEWIIAIFIAIILGCFALIITDIKLWFFILLIFAIPSNADVSFFLHPDHIGGANCFRITAVDVLLYVLLIFWLLDLISVGRERIVTSKELIVAPLLLIVVSTLSLLNAPDWGLGALEIIRMFKVFLVYLLTINYVTDIHKFRLCVLALLLGLSIQIILGLLQWSFNTTFGLTIIGEDLDLASHSLEGYGDVPRVGGTIGPSGDFAKYLGLLIPIPFMLLFSKIKGSYKFICLLILLFGIVILIMTLTRVAWIAIPFSFLVIFFLLIRKKLLRGKIIIIMSATTILMFLIVMPFTGIIKSRFISEDYGSAYERIPLMKVALSIIKSNPVLGVGINNYQEVMGKYDTTKEHISDTGSPVHNLFLLTAAETGIPGLIIFLWVFFIFMKKMIDCLKSKNEFISLMGIAFFAGFSSLLIQSLTGMGYRTGEIIMTVTWVLGGLAVAASSLDPANLDLEI